MSAVSGNPGSTTSSIASISDLSSANGATPKSATVINSLAASTDSDSRTGSPSSVSSGSRSSGDVAITVDDVAKDTIVTANPTEAPKLPEATQPATEKPFLCRRICRVITCPFTTLVSLICRLFACIFGCCYSKKAGPIEDTTPTTTTPETLTPNTSAPNVSPNVVPSASNIPPTVFEAIEDIENNLTDEQHEAADREMTQFPREKWSPLTHQLWNEYLPAGKAEVHHNRIIRAKEEWYQRAKAKWSAFAQEVWSELSPKVQKEEEVQQRKIVELEWKSKPQSTWSSLSLEIWSTLSAQEKQTYVEGEWYQLAKYEWSSLARTMWSDLPDDKRQEHESNRLGFAKIQWFTEAPWSRFAIEKWQEMDRKQQIEFFGLELTQLEARITEPVRTAANSQQMCEKIRIFANNLKWVVGESESSLDEVIKYQLALDEQRNEKPNEPSSHSAAKEGGKKEKAEQQETLDQLIKKRQQGARLSSEELDLLEAYESEMRRSRRAQLIRKRDKGVKLSSDELNRLHDFKAVSEMYLTAEKLQKEAERRVSQQKVAQQKEIEKRVAQQRQQVEKEKKSEMHAVYAPVSEASHSKPPVTNVLVQPAVNGSNGGQRPVANGVKPAATEEDDDDGWL